MIYENKRIFTTNLKLFIFLMEFSIYSINYIFSVINFKGVKHIKFPV